MGGIQWQSQQPMGGNNLNFVLFFLFYLVLFSNYMMRLRGIDTTGRQTKDRTNDKTVWHTKGGSEPFFSAFLSSPLTKAWYVTKIVLRIVGATYKSVWTCM